eukprot:1696119-Amphidinium_carterae.1
MSEELFEFLVSVTLYLLYLALQSLFLWFLKICVQSYAKRRLGRGCCLLPPMSYGYASATAAASCPNCPQGASTCVG